MLRLPPHATIMNGPRHRRRLLLGQLDDDDVVRPATNVNASIESEARAACRCAVVAYIMKVLINGAIINSLLCGVHILLFSRRFSLISTSKQ